MSEVQRGWLSSPHRKTHVWVPAFGLQERKGTGVKAEKWEGREGSHNHTQQDTNFTRTPLHTSSHKIPNPSYPKHTHPHAPHHTCPGRQRATPHVHHLTPPDTELQARRCWGVHTNRLHPSPPSTQPTGSRGHWHASVCPAHTCPFPQPCSHLLFLMALAGVLRPLCGQCRPDTPALCHTAQLLTVCGWHVGHDWGPAAGGQLGLWGLPRNPPLSVCSLVPDTPPVQLLSAGPFSHIPPLEGGQPLLEASAWLFRAP